MDIDAIVVSIIHDENIEIVMEISTPDFEGEKWRCMLVVGFSRPFTQIPMNMSIEKCGLSKLILD